MRVIFVPPDERYWSNYYHQSGRGFAGWPYQRGAGLGSLFSGLIRAILPVARSVGTVVGRQALASGADLAGDILAGKSIKRSVKRRGRLAASNLLHKAGSAISQSGSGRRRRRRRRRRRVTIARKTLIGRGRRRRRRRRKRQTGRGLGKRPLRGRYPRARRRRGGGRRKRRRVDVLGAYYG